MDYFSPFYLKKGMNMIEDSELLELIKASNDYAMNFFSELEIRNKFLNQTLSSIARAEDMSKNYEECIDSLYDKLNNLNPNNYNLTKQSIFGNSYQKYYKAVKKQEPQISNQINLLANQQEILKRDNITLNIEVSKITAMIQDLYNIYAEGQELEKRIHTKINTIKNEPDTKIFVDSALLPLQRKLFEIQQMITIKTQTIMTINIVQKNNLTVIQNIDNIKNVTLGALKILAASAKAKSDQAELSKCFNNTELRLNEANIIVKNTLPENDTKLNELKTN